MGRPLQARAANGDYVQLGSGYTATYQTKIRNASTARGDGPDNRTLWLESVNGGALLARGHYGVSGEESSTGSLRTGVLGRATGVGTYGVYGVHDFAVGFGVYGKNEENGNYDY